RVVSLGDAGDSFSPAGRASEVIRFLRQAYAVGVWGNHDINLCVDVPQKLRRQAGPAALEYMAGMQPQLVIAGCRFSHVEPWLDARQVKALWYFDGLPDTPEKASRSFADRTGALSVRWPFPPLVGNDTFGPDRVGW